MIITKTDYIQADSGSSTLSSTIDMYIDNNFVITVCTAHQIDFITYEESKFKYNNIYDFSKPKKDFLKLKNASKNNTRTILNKHKYTKQRC
jgi:hypothetical protein